MAAVRPAQPVPTMTTFSTLADMGMRAPKRDNIAGSATPEMLAGGMGVGVGSRVDQWCRPGKDVRRTGKAVTHSWPHAVFQAHPWCPPSRRAVGTTRRAALCRRGGFPDEGDPEHPGPRRDGSAPAVEGRKRL